MGRGKRLVGLGVLFVFTSLSMLMMGVPYEPLTVVAADLRQYGEENTPASSCLAVSDQDVASGSVLVDRACATRRGWVVIYNDQNGAPGDPIGMTLVTLGVNEDIPVEIDLSQASATLHAQLHQDLGEPEVFDSSDVIEAGPAAFAANGVGQATTAPQATATPTEAPAPTAATAPPQATPTPEAGAGLFSGTNIVILVGLGLLCLVGLGLIGFALWPIIQNRRQQG